MSETIETIIAWHKETFPKATSKSQIDKFNEETKEFEESHDIEELADMFIAAIGLARFDLYGFVASMAFVTRYRDMARVGIDDLNKAIKAKMRKNRLRKWHNNQHVEV